MTIYVTQCPACRQAYKVSEQTLSIKDGRVRCGFCNNVFNAREHLYRSAELESGIRRVEREAEMEREGIAAMKSLAGALEGFEPVDTDRTSLVGVRADATKAPEKSEMINSGTTIEIISHPAAGQTIESDVQDAEDDDEYYEESEPRRSRSWLWVLIAIVAVGAIAVKLAAMNRNTIVEKLPQATSLMNSICSVLTCEPARSEAPLDAPIKKEGAAAAKTSQVTISNYKLEPVTGNEYLIRVNLKNNGSSQEDYPVLTVVLKGEKEDILTRRQVLPKDYLPTGAKSLAGGEEAQVALAFNLEEGTPESLSVEIEPVL